MTPYQHSRLSPRTRMLAGLNTLGFISPGGSSLFPGGGNSLLPNSGVVTKTSTGAVVGTAEPVIGFQKTSLAPQGSTLAIDPRNTGASNLLSKTNAPQVQPGAVKAALTAPITSPFEPVKPSTLPSSVPLSVPKNLPPVSMQPAPGASWTNTPGSPGSRSWETDPQSFDTPPSVMPDTSTPSPLVPVPQARSVSPVMVAAGVGVAGLLVYLFVIR